MDTAWSSVRSWMRVGTRIGGSICLQSISRPRLTVVMAAPRLRAKAQPGRPPLPDALILRRARGKPLDRYGSTPHTLESFQIRTPHFLRTPVRVVRGPGQPRKGPEQRERGG